ncbi:MAG: phosphodiester glycosidase family protein, partial [Planctomycetes bacterium]|nr:phosphodiester glycosidase family protein [Planctomycetota bacterium]
MAAACAPTLLHGETIAPGVTYTLYNAPGPNNVHVIAVDRLRSEYKFELGYAQGKRNYTAREAVTQIFSRYDNPPVRDVLSATNAAYFDPSNPPRLLGIGQTNGEMMDTPSFNPTYVYHTVMVGPARAPIVRTNFDHVPGTLRFPDGYSMTLTQYNYYMGGQLVPINGVTAFTPTFDSSTRSNFLTPSIAVEAILTNVSYPMRGDKEVSGIVSAINTPTAGNAAIPAGGMVLSAYGSTKNEIVAHAHVGDRLRMRFASGAEEYNNADCAVTGIGWVIHGGAAYPTGWANLESGASPYSRNPRSVLAWNNNTWFQVVCDGRSGISVGMTFQEMADFLIGTLGATEAVNYDGGGSAEMVVNGTVRNVPSDGSERPVANAILLVKRDTATVFPVGDPFASSGRAAGWDDKFSYNDVVAFAPPSPGGDGYVLKVINPNGGVETTRRGDFGDADYTVRADIYCEYRPADAADGYERYA